MDEPGRRFIRRQFAASRIGGGQIVAVFADTGSCVTVPEGAVAALGQCLAFDTLDGHAVRVAQALKLPEDARPKLRQELDRLRGLGLLVSWEEFTRVPAGGANANDRSAITAIGVLTRDRPLALARCLESHVSHMQRSGRTAAVTVMDSSPSIEVQRSNRAAAEQIATALRWNVRYAGPADKQAFGLRLAQAADVDPAVVRFALQDVHGCGNDAGSNRNALLLGHCGELFLSSDDDVICQPHVAGEVDDDVRLTAAADPTEVTLFESFDDARRSVQPVASCLLDAHEALLGRNLRAIFAQRAPAGLADERIEPALMRALVSASSRVAVTSSALVGDSGARYPVFYAWSAGARRQLEAQPPERYRGLLTSRQIVRRVARNTVTPGPFFMSTHVGIDHRGFLPPFFPVLRGQDLTFGRLLRVSSDAALIGHIPLGILHVPVEARAVSLDSLWPKDRSPSFASLLNACLQLAAQNTRHAAGGPTRLRLLGTHLRVLAALDRRELSALVRAQLLEAAAPALEGWARQLAQVDVSSSGWLRDLVGLRDSRISQITSPDLLAAAELVGANGVAGASDLVQVLLGEFGVLLERWPDLVAAAAGLNARGEGLFQPVA